MDSTLQNIVPYQVFEAACDAIRVPINVTVTQSGDYVYLSGDVDRINNNSFIEVDCGDLNGRYRVSEAGHEEENSKRLKIKYDGSFDASGTILAYPYFYWGSLMKISETVQKTQEYPLIALVLPDPYSINKDDENAEFINDVFKVLIMDKFETAKDSSEYETQRIFNTVVSDMSQMSLDFINALEYNELIKDVTDIQRSEEIPFGVTVASNQDGKTAALFDVHNAGCYLDMRVIIDKQYNNCT